MHGQKKHQNIPNIKFDQSPSEGEGALLCGRKTRQSLHSLYATVLHYTLRRSVLYFA